MNAENNPNPISDSLQASSACWEDMEVCMVIWSHVPEVKQLQSLDVGVHAASATGFTLRSSQESNKADTEEQTLLLQIYWFH